MPRFWKKSKFSKRIGGHRKSCTLKAYLHFYLDSEDSFEDEIDYYVLVKLAVLKSMQCALWSPYQTWNSNWERMLYDGAYMRDDEFLSNFWMDRACIPQLNELVKNDETFSNCWSKKDKGPVMLHIMVFLKHLGSYGNEASLQKIGWTMGISKGAVHDCAVQA